jgi:hypothetical protein
MPGPPFPVVTYCGYYLRGSTAERAFQTCHRRGWEPVLGRRLGVWVVGVRLDPVQPFVVTGEPQSGQRNGLLAASSRRIA